jgi:dTDP-4-dehydrorhamnose reductase
VTPTGREAPGPTSGEAARPAVLLFGAAGQLGRATAARLESRATVTPLARPDVDLTDARATRAAVIDRRPEVVINCAAYNNVDGAEGAAAAALTVNAMAVGTMARAAADVGAILVHYGSDFVFDGRAGVPYTEEDAPEPQSVYAQSKLLGEWLAADAPRHYVLRVESLFGGPGARSSVDRIVAAVREGRETPVFVDRTTSPSYTEDVVEATWHLVTTGAPFGTYHCVNSGHAAWIEVGHEIARLLGRPSSSVKPVSVKDVVLKASRPLFAALSNEKLARAGFVMPAWQDALRRHLARL